MSITNSLFKQCMDIFLSNEVKNNIFLLIFQLELCKEYGFFH